MLPPLRSSFDMPSIIRPSFDAPAGKTTGAAAVKARYLNPVTKQERSLRGQQAKMAELLNSPAKPANRSHTATLDAYLRENPADALHLSPSHARLVDRSIFTEGAAKMATRAGDYGTKADKSRFRAQKAYEDLRESLANTDIFAKLPPVLDEKNFLELEGTMPQKHQTKFNIIKEHLSHEKMYLEQKELDNSRAHGLNLMAQVFQHPSYRGLARAISPNMRNNLMMWLNVIGMLTMVLTIPLMYEGLKQWGQSVVAKSPQGGDQQQQ